MHNEFTAIVEQDGHWYVAYCAEVPGANGQGKTREECLASLREAIALILEYGDRARAHALGRTRRRAMPKPFRVMARFQTTWRGRSAVSYRFQTRPDWWFCPRLRSPASAVRAATRSQASSANAPMPKMEISADAPTMALTFD